MILLNLLRPQLLTSLRTVPIPFLAVSLLLTIHTWAGSHDTLELPSLDIHKKGHPAPSQKLTQPFTSLHPWDLEKNQGNTIADVLKNLPGLDMRTMGPAPARPVYRGMSGDRVKVMENGSPVQDLSASSPDHAVTLDPLSVENLELIKGPDILIHSSSTLGGLVSAESQDSPEYLQHTHVRIVNTLTSYYQPQTSIGQLQLPIHSSATFGQLQLPIYVSNHSTRFWTGFQASGGFRDAENTITPNKELKNTNLSVNHANLTSQSGIGKNQLHLGYQHYHSEYGIPPTPESVSGRALGHPNGADIDMERKKIHVLGILGELPWNIEPIQIQYDETYYNHVEYHRTPNGRDTSIGAAFYNHIYRGHILAPLPPFKGAKQTTGLEMTYHTLDMGGFVFTPPVHSLSYGLFYLIENKFNSLEWKAGLRIDGAKLETQYDNRFDSQAPNRDFLTWASSISGFYHWNENQSSSATISSSTRIPTIEELYSKGPHLAAYSYEIGDSSLSAEEGYGLELAQYFRGKWGNFSVLGFWNEFPSYILSQANGDTNWAQILPIYQSKNIHARMLGFESALQLRLGPYFSLQPHVSYVWAVNADLNEPVPMTPPLKGQVTFRYKKRLQFMDVRMDWSAPQNRVDGFEGTTEGYTTYSLFFQQGFHYHMQHRIHIGVENVLNSQYHNHLSRLKKIQGEPGRNFKILLSHSF